MKAASETSQAQVYTNVKKDKDRKKWSLLPIPAGWELTILSSCTHELVCCIVLNFDWKSNLFSNYLACVILSWSVKYLGGRCHAYLVRCCNMDQHSMVVFINQHSQEVSSIAKPCMIRRRTFLCHRCAFDSSSDFYNFCFLRVFTPCVCVCVLLFIFFKTGSHYVVLTVLASALCRSVCPWTAILLFLPPDGWDYKRKPAYLALLNFSWGCIGLKYCYKRGLLVIPSPNSIDSYSW